MGQDPFARRGKDAAALIYILVGERKAAAFINHPERGEIDGGRLAHLQQANHETVLKYGE